MFFYEEILRAFQADNVKYVIVGGIAVNLLGLMRSTADLDILVEMSNDNLKKIVIVMKKMGYHVKLPVDPMGMADTKTRQEWIGRRHMKAFNFYKGDGLKEVDIIIESPVSFAEARRVCKKVKIDDLTLPVISVDKLIKMKAKTGRAIDKMDIRELKKLKKFKVKI